MVGCAEGRWVVLACGTKAETCPVPALGTGLALPRMFSGGSGGFGFCPRAAVFGGSSQVASERTSDLKQSPPPGLLKKVAKGHWKL